MADERVQPVAERVRHPGKEPRVLVGVPEASKLSAERVGPGVVPQGRRQYERQGYNDEQFASASAASLRGYRGEMRKWLIVSLKCSAPPNRLPRSRARLLRAPGAPLPLLGAGGTSPVMGAGGTSPVMGVGDSVVKAFLPSLRQGTESLANIS